MARIIAILTSGMAVQPSNGRHEWQADEPVSAGGEDTGPDPHELPMGVENNAGSGSDDVEAYRYKHFTTRLLFRDLRFARKTAGPGEALPSFELVTTNSDRIGNKDLFGDKPVLFIFGSMTCPNTASAAPHVQQLQDEFAGRVEFIMVYVREAHPGECIPQADTLQNKLDHARALKAFYGIQWTVAADKIDGDLHRALDPKPNSAFLINSEGVILFRSLWAADRYSLRMALEAAATNKALKRRQSVALIGPVARAMGQVHEVMARGGPQAVRDLWKAGFPIALAGLMATWFSPLSPDQRGIAAVLTMVLGLATVIGMVGIRFFA